MMSAPIIAAAAPLAAISTQGLVNYLQSLFGPLFLGIVGIVALFFLFTREITRFVQFIVLAVAIAVGNGDLRAAQRRRRDTGRHAGGRPNGSGAGRDGRAATRHNLRHVGRRPAKPKMVCKGHPCIYAADGYPMTRFASSWAVPCGPHLPRKLTDVHGKEG